ncbi:MAG: hypothetical protein ABIA59_06955 [Candidatus Latescibacterota bacterium]
MRIRVLLLAGIFVFLAGDTFALQRESAKHERTGVSVRGKKGRKQIRHLLFREKLQGDKLAVYDEYGYTPHRLRLREFGEVSERWKYNSRGIEFTFDDEGNLTSTSRFQPQTGHID